MKERVVLSFIAAAVGILVAGVAFSFYQHTKTAPKEVRIAPSPAPTKVPTQTLFLHIETPKPEEVVTTRAVTVSGKTQRHAVVTVSTTASDYVFTPTASGDFTTTVTIDAGVNQIVTAAIAPNGEEVTETRTVTFSTESF